MNKSEKRQNRISDPAQRVQAYYDNVLSSLIDGIVVVDHEFRITTFSATAEQMTEIKAGSVQGKKLSEIFDEKSGIHALVMKTIRTGRSYSDSNFSIYGYFGDRHDIGLATSPLIDFQGRSIGVVIVFRDLSQVKSLEERLRKGERLASLGILAAGMAHEIKNPLGGIRGASQLLSKEMGEGHLMQEYTDVIIREVDRLNMIIQGLLDFSSPPELKLRPTNIHQVLERVASLVRMESPSDKVRFIRNFDPSLPEVPADPDQLSQVFLNLFKNGIEAMGGEGLLSLTTRMLPGYRMQDGEHEKKGMIAVDVEDTGCGIDPGEIGKIFDPFCTHKAGGVGLGLSISHRIIEEHGGKIEVTSTPGKGTCFHVCLPVAIPGKDV